MEIFSSIAGGMSIRETMREGRRGWSSEAERGGRIIMLFSMAISPRRSRNIGIILRLIWRSILKMNRFRRKLMK